MKSSFVLSAFEKEQYALTTKAFEEIVQEMYGTNEEVRKELEAFARKYGKDGVVTYKEARKWASRDDHRKRLTVLFLYICLCYDRLFPKIEKIMENHLKTIIGNEYALFGKKTPDYKAMEKPWGVQDKTWRDNLHGYRRRWEAINMRDVRLGVLRSDPVDEIIAEYDRQAERERNLINALLVTETTAVGSIARGEILKELGETKYRIYTRPDERRCEHCASLHGRVFPFSAYRVGETAPPFHTRCRCWIEQEG